MSQVLVLLLYVFWIVALPARGATLTVNPSRLAWFCAGFALIVLVPAVIIRYRVSRLGAVNAWQLHLRTLRLIAVCRVAIVVWFVAGLFYGATWVEFVQGLLGGAGSGAGIKARQTLARRPHDRSEFAFVDHGEMRLAAPQEP